MIEERLLKRKQRAQRDGNIRQLADILKELGDFYFENGKLEEALQEYMEQVNACEILEEELERAIAYRMIGEIHASMGNYEDAFDYQNRHLEGARKLENLIEEQRAFATLGRTYFCFSESLIDKPAERENALMNAKRAYSKSIRLCSKLQGSINEREEKVMQARLMLNLGLVLEAQKFPEEAVQMIEKATKLCSEHNLIEDLHRTNLALGALHERREKYDLALEFYERSVNVNEPAMKADAYLAKAELLLKLGEWFEARKPLVKLYIMKNLSEDIRKETERLLRIAVTICRAEDDLLIESSVEVKEKLYETLGDAAVEVKSYEKAIDYYGKMLMCAEECRSDKIGAALVSLAQTMQDAGRSVEALTYARRELQLCKEPREACRSALYLADLMISAKCPDFEIREQFNEALNYAKEINNVKLKISVLNDLCDYLKSIADLEGAENIKSSIKELEGIVEIESDDKKEKGEEEEEEEEATSQKIGDTICLDDLSDVEEALNRSEGVHKPRRVFKRGFQVKKNSVGETQLHVACINGNIENVERYLAEGHPVNVRDNFGWSPLHEAANHGFVEIARELVKAGADVNDPGGIKCEGVTPLHDAASCGHFSMIYFLIESGANVNVLTERGETVLDCLEGWKNREGELSDEIQGEYDFCHEKLRRSITVTSKSQGKSIVSRRKSKLIDEDEEEELNEVTKSKRANRISAGEDYKRTIASLKHRGGLIGSSSFKHSNIQKVTAPLLDSDQLLDEDWLEDDLGVRTKKRHSSEMPVLNDKRTFTESSSIIKKNSSSDSAIISKRKSSNGLEQNEQADLKRQRKFSFDSDSESCEDSRVSISSNESLSPELKIKRRRKRTRQLSLLKSGFTREMESPSPSSIVLDSDDYSTIQRAINHQILHLSVLLDWDIYEITLKVLDNYENIMENLLEELKEKFEKDTGCKAKLKILTWEGVELSVETALSIFKSSISPIKLKAEITDLYTPSIVERYKFISKNHRTCIQESTLKCLKVCENTTVFRLNSRETLDEELVVILKSLQYQKSLQTLYLSGGNFFDQGKVLNTTLQRLSSLYELHLQNCYINSRVLAKIDKFPEQLRILNLSYNPLKSQSQEKLQNLIQPLKNLQSLNLRNCKLEKFSLTLICESLENLDVSWNPLGGDGVCQFLQRRMMTLSISNTQTPCSSTSIVSKIINNPRCSLFALESLELASCKITDIDVRRILSETPNLSKITLGGNKDVTKVSVYALLKREPTLFYIDVGGCSEIVDLPSTDVRIANPEVCTLIVSMNENVVDAWENLWRGKGIATKLPYNVVILQPT